MNEKIRQILLKADKPVRYAGGEVNAYEVKENAKQRFLMCFPDVYEVAHSNLGIKILYSLINEIDGMSAEMCFAPWTDMAELLKNENVPLFSLEGKRPMNEFDIVGFSMQYEMSYTTVLKMLELGNVPIFSRDRGENDPVVIAGGPCTVNPMPLEPFFDLFAIGDGEVETKELCELKIKCAEEKVSRSEFIKRAAEIEGIYAPAFKKDIVRRAVITDLDAAFYPTKILVPNMQAIHNRAVLEIFRGCTRGCRFCQAGMIYRPVRERSVDTLVSKTEELILNNGFDEISLSSLSTCDYPPLRELLTRIKPITDLANVQISLPSTRVDSFEEEFVASSRKSSLTFAPEAGTQRLRDVINKNVTEEDILSSCAKAFKSGYSSVKLYFMIGLPTETREDINGIVDLVKKIRKVFKENKCGGKPLNISVSTSTFVPKPFTPFQWEKQLSISEIQETQMYLKNELRPLGVRYAYHDCYTSRIEAILARGDISVSKAVYTAYKAGANLEGWSEMFNYSIWGNAFEAEKVNADKFADGFELSETLPWDFICVGVDKSFLLSEREKAYNGALTNDCRNGCHNCGVNKNYKAAFEFNCKKNCKKD